MEKRAHQSLEDIEKLAVELAAKYRNQDITIGLVGPLGAGKTTFTKAFAKALGIKKITSPTFVVGHRHKFGSRFLYHFDFYRLDHETALKPLGLDAIFSQSNRIILIEWVNKFPSLQKKCDLVISFKIESQNLRHVTIK